MLNLGHAWTRVKHTAGRAWTTGNKVLAAADRYADLAARVLDTGVLGQRAMHVGREAMQHYAQGRAAIDTYRNSATRMHQHVKRAVPEMRL